MAGMSSSNSILWRRFTSWVRRSFNVLWLVALASYFLVLAGQSVYKNYQTRQQTSDLQKQLVTAQKEDTRLQAMLVYYQTDSFKEKELRRTLLLQEPGEKVFALPESGMARQPGDDIVKEAAPVAKPDQRPIWRQWADYLMHKA